MKISKALLALGLLSGVAFAQGAFVGFEAGYSLKTEMDIDGDKLKDKAPAFGIKAGYDFDFWRAYGSYHYYAESEDSFNGNTVKFKAHKFLINADYTPKISNNTKLILGAYTGISSGTMEIDVSGSGSVEDDGRDLTIGARLGVEYSMNNSSAVEFGLKYDHTKYDVEGESWKLKETNAGLYLGYTYKF